MFTGPLLQSQPGAAARLPGSSGLEAWWDFTELWLHCGIGIILGVADKYLATGGRW